MKLTFSKIVNETKRTTEMMLYGVIGSEINGHDFARELNWLGQNYDEIRIRVNSDGGSISQGLSIVAEMLASPARIIAQVDGIAASMAAVILAAADRVVINDYAKVMVHSPYYTDDNGEKIKTLSVKDQKGLAMLKDTLVTLLSKRGIDKEEIGKMMRTDSWFTADEALTSKLVDEVIATGRKKELAGLDIKRLVALLKDEVNNSNFLNMKQLIARFKLADNADEQAVMNAVDQLETSFKGKLDKLVNKLIEAGKAAGSITEKNEAAMKRLAGADIELFVDMLSLDKVEANPAEETETGKKPENKEQNVRLSDVVAQLAAAAKGGNTGTSEKDWDWFQKNDPAGLAAMETKEPEKFKKLQAAYESKFV
ncbi:MAG: Clp protease ClpP [Desulfotomaculaceae bacterium]